MKAENPKEEARGIATAAASTSEANVAASLRLIMSEVTIREVQAALGAEGIGIIVLKGPHFACILYEDPRERRFQDLDLLVAPGHFLRAGEILRSKGFRLVPGEKGRKVSWSHSYHWQYISPRGVLVELHRAWADHGRYGYDSEAVFARAVRFRIGKVEALGLGTEDLICFLCVHAAKSYMVIDVKHLVDLALAIEKMNPNWTRVSERISEVDVRSAAYGYLLAAREQAGARVPPEVLNRFRPMRLKRKWLEHHLDCSVLPLYRFMNHGDFQRKLRLEFALSDSLGDSIRFLARYVKVRVEDWCSCWSFRDPSA